MGLSPPIGLMLLATCLMLTSYPNANGQDAGAERRLWSDVTGKFQIDAVMLDHTDKAVRLKKSDGRVITVPLAKLSQKDREFLASLKPKQEANPFAGGEVPVMNGKIAAVGENLNALVNFRCDDVQPLPDQSIELQVGGTEPPAALSPDPGLPLPKLRPFAAKIADTDAYDKLQPAVLLDSSAGLFAVSIGRHKSNDTENRRGRVMLTRMGSPQSSTAIDAVDTIDLLDHHQPSDRTLAVIGKDKLYRGGELCLLESIKLGDATVRLRRTLPGIDKPGFKPQVEWARLVGPDHAVVRVNDVLYCWNLVENQLKYKVSGVKGNPSLSPGGKYMAIPQTGKAAIVATPTGETLGTVAAQNPLLSPAVQFDPTGSKLALVAGNQISVWDLAAAKLTCEITTLNPTGTLAGWVDDRHILTQLAGLVDTELGLPIWNYSLPTGGLVTTIAGGIVAIDKLRGAYIMALPVPHPPARQIQQRLAAGGDENYLINPGTEVSIKIESTTGGVKESEIRQSLAKAVERAGWVVANSASTTLVAKIGRGQQQTLQYQMRSIGQPRGANPATQTATITPFTMSFEIQRDGEELWSRQTENRVPRMLFMRGKDETLQDAVSKYEKPDAGFFERLTLPPRILKQELRKATGRSTIKDGAWSNR